MKILGLDIGTTTVSAVVTENGRVLAAETQASRAFLPGRPAWEKAQDAAALEALALATADRLLARFPGVERIGLTGQQHGIVYLDAAGNLLSSLYTWQDGRGELPCSTGQSYCACLSELTGYPLATGYGLVTHFYNLKNGLVPANAVTFCTIHDYLAMRLAGRSTPAVDPSDAASFGVFDVKNRRFDTEALARAGIDAALLPPVAAEPLLGTGPRGIPVYTAIGDNQASFLGATGGEPGCMLVNVGTGSQFSVHTAEYLPCAGLETRPFPTGGYLLAGSSLCGGRAYALLEQFFRQTAQMLGHPAGSCYEAMARLLDSSPVPDDPAVIMPLFQGTRENPQLRGSITNLSIDNFTPLSLLYGMMRGMAAELHEMYLRSGTAGGALYGSGNGLRKNPQLRRCFEEAFGKPLLLSQNEEEAACGAALFASMQ